MMTREEAIEYFKMKVSAREAIGNDIGTDYEAYKIALTALRPFSREQVILCRDCRFWQDNNGGYPHPECRWGNDETPDADDYCSFAEKMPILTPPNELLTIEQLREMDGEPVYIVFSPDVDGEKLQFWALVAVDKWGEVYLMNNFGGSSTYEEAWTNIEAIYRRPPERQEDT